MKMTKKRTKRKREDEKNKSEDIIPLEALPIKRASDEPIPKKVCLKTNFKYSIFFFIKTLHLLG